MSFRPPIPTGSTRAARWFKWFQDAVQEIEVNQSSGALVRRTSRGTFIDFQNRRKSVASAVGPQFDSFGFRVEVEYTISTGVSIPMAPSITGAFNCRVGSVNNTI